jgi:dihydroorotate dehydrogenase electron transfer subunit
MTGDSQRAESVSARVLRHAPFAAGYREISFEAPTIAARAQPGQFVHLRVPRLHQRLLRRPFSIYRSEGGEVAVLYKVVGAGTASLAEVAAGEAVSLIGPLGNGFPAPDAGATPVAVAGGYGVAPLSFLASRLGVRGVAFIGAARAADVLCAADFERLGWDVRVTTEDGSLGRRGLVTDALDRWAGERAGGPEPELFACGPDGMLRAVGERAVAQGWKAWLSLDKRMGCGMGACLACVQRLRFADGHEAWARVCREGPVFEARQVVWPGKA